MLHIFQKAQVTTNKMNHFSGTYFHTFNMTCSILLQVLASTTFQKVVIGLPPRSRNVMLHLLVTSDNPSPYFWPLQLKLKKMCLKTVDCLMVSIHSDAYFYSVNMLLWSVDIAT